MTAVLEALALDVLDCRRRAEAAVSELAVAARSARAAAFRAKALADAGQGEPGRAAELEAIAAAADGAATVAYRQVAVPIGPLADAAAVTLAELEG